METPAEHLSRFVSDVFPGASLPPPRFESLPYLRFELGGGLTPWYRLPIGSSMFDLPGPLSRRRRRIAQAIFRAAALFEAAIPAGHGGFLDAYLWPIGGLMHSREAEARLLGLLPEAVRASVVASEVSDFWGDGEDEDDGQVVRLTAALELRQLDYRTLFRLIAHDELGLKSAVGARVYLVDATDPLVFLMYDDRGAILHAPTVDRLRSLYESSREWLVDHDRATIDPLFIGEP